MCARARFGQGRWGLREEVALSTRGAGGYERVGGSRNEHVAVAGGGEVVGRTAASGAIGILAGDDSDGLGTAIEFSDLPAGLLTLEATIT